MAVEAKDGKTSRGAVKAIEHTSFESMAALNAMLEKHKKVVLRFTAGYCNPCKSLKKWLDEEYKPKGLVRVVEIDIENRSNEGVLTLCSMFGVRSLPTVIIVKENMEVVDKVVGLNIPAIESSLDKNFS